MVENYNKELEQIAKKVVHNCIMIKKKENLLIDVDNIDNFFLPNQIALECEKIGAYPLIITRPKDYFFQRLMDVPNINLRETSQHLIPLLKNTDARIGVSTFLEDSLTWKSCKLVSMVCY